VTHHNDGHDGEPYYYAFKELHKEHSASDLIELNAGALHVDAFASDLSLHNYDAPFPDDVAFPQSAFPRRKVRTLTCNPCPASFIKTALGSGTTAVSKPRHHKRYMSLP
jgi:hypothetical protein